MFCKPAWAAQPGQAPLDAMSGIRRGRREAEQERQGGGL